MEATDMYATMPEIAPTDALGTWPTNAPFTRPRSNEVDLVARLQARDEAAFGEIVERYGSKIYQVSYGILAIATMRMRLHRRSSPRFISPSTAS